MFDVIIIILFIFVGVIIGFYSIEIFLFNVLLEVINIEGLCLVLFVFIFLIGFVVGLVF